jgi:hypothetical protein
LFSLRGIEADKSELLFVLCRTERSQCATAPVDVATPMQINDSTIEHQHDVCTEEQ